MSQPLFTSDSQFLAFAFDKTVQKQCTTWPGSREASHSGCIATPPWRAAVSLGMTGLPVIGQAFNTPWLQPPGLVLTARTGQRGWPTQLPHSTDPQVNTWQLALCPEPLLIPPNLLPGKKRPPHRPVVVRPIFPKTNRMKAGRSVHGSSQSIQLLFPAAAGGFNTSPTAFQLPSAVGNEQILPQATPTMAAASLEAGCGSFGWEAPPSPATLPGRRSG